MHHTGVVDSNRIDNFESAIMILGQARWIITQMPDKPGRNINEVVLINCCAGYTECTRPLITPAVPWKLIASPCPGTPSTP